MTSTGLRHHVAKMNQIAGKDNAYVNALSQFMGHTPGTHKGNAAMILYVFNITCIISVILQETICSLNWLWRKV